MKQITNTFFRKRSVLINCLKSNPSIKPIREYAVLNKKAQQALRIDNRDVPESNLAYFYDVPKYTDLVMNLNELYSIYLNKLAVITKEESLFEYKNDAFSLSEDNLSLSEKEELLNKYESLHKINKLLKLGLEEQQHLMLIVKIEKILRLEQYTDAGLLISNKVHEFLERFKKENTNSEIFEDYSNIGQRGLMPKMFDETSQTVLSFGRRKTSFAKLFLTPQYIEEGNSEMENVFMVNDRPVSHYFNFLTEPVNNCIYPFEVINNYKYVVKCYVKGSGMSAQSGAIELALARALAFLNSEYHEVLDQNNMLTMDLRQVERKKTNKVKARKSYTWRKR